MSGLVSTLKGDLQKKLDKAVSEDKLTKQQAARIMNGAEKMITAAVNGKFPGPPPNGKGWFREHRGFGPGMQGGAPPAAPGMDA